MECKI